MLVIEEINYLTRYTVLVNMKMRMPIDIKGGHFHFGLTKKICQS